MNTREHSDSNLQQANPPNPTVNEIPENHRQTIHNERRMLQEEIIQEEINDHYYYLPQNYHTPFDGHYHQIPFLLL